MIFYVPGGKYELMLPLRTPPRQPMVTGVPNLVDGVKAPQTSSPRLTVE